jgi:ribosomal-protein-alanine N-acetyltransferase
MPDERVPLRPIEEADLNLLRRLDTDPAVCQLFEWTCFRHPGARRRRREKDGRNGRDSPTSPSPWPDGILARIMGWHAIKAGGPGGGCLEIGTPPFPEHRGRELGTAAQRLLVEYLFATKLVNLVEQQVLECIGFRREGVMRLAALRRLDRRCLTISMWP